MGWAPCPAPCKLEDRSLEDRSNCSDTFPVSANTPGTHATHQEGDAAQLAERGRCAPEKDSMVLSECAVLEMTLSADRQT